LDTVDLLLHNEVYRHEILSLIRRLYNIGCGVVLTCRPEEFEVSLKKQFKCETIYLEDYNNKELTEAINNHVNRFYAYTDKYKRGEALKKINNAVALELPVSRVCVNPLTLRMLFILYAPQDVPEEINVFELYQNYWENRVKADKRAGEKSIDQSPNSSANLSNTAIIVALTILIEGSLELNKRQLKNALEELKGSWQEMKRLVARGILRDSNEKIHFFHQTFFEHSAAQGMLGKFGQEGLKLLENYIKTKNYDLFVVPIYEHALLLAEQKNPPIRQQADKGLLSLMQESHITAKNAAIYVYAHRRKTCHIDEKFFTFLREESTPTEKSAPTTTIDYFLKIASNMSKERSGVLFNILDTIWKSEVRGAKHHCLDLIERWAAREPTKVRNFLEYHSLYQEVLTPHGQDYTRHFLRILVLLAQHDLDWCLENLLQLYASAKNDELKVAIIEAILHVRVNVFSNKDIIVRFEHLHSESERVSEELTRTYGKLLSVQWKAWGFSPSDVISKELSKRQGMRYKVALNGIAEMFLEGDVYEGEIGEAFEHFKQESNIEWQMLWGTITWSRLLKEANNKSIHIKTELCHMITRSLHDCVQYKTKSLGICKSLRIAVKNGQLDSKTLLNILNIPELNSSELWLNKDGFGQLLAQAFVVGHSGAKAAVEDIESRTTLPEISRVFCSELKKYVPKNIQATEIFFKITLKAEDVHQLLDLFEDKTLLTLAPSPAPLPPVIKEHAQKIEEFVRKLLKAPLGKERRCAYRLWAHLLYYDLVTIPMETLCQHMREEDDETGKGWIIVLMGHSTKKGFYPVEKVYELLSPLCKGQNENLGNQAFFALSLASFSSSASPQFIVQLLDIASNGEHFKHFGYILEYTLLNHKKELAVDLLKKMIIKVTNSKIGQTGRHNFANKLRKPVSSLFRSIPIYEQEQLLEIIPQLDKFSGRLLIDAACSESFDSLHNKLESFMNHPDVVEGIKKLIRGQQYVRERTSGGEGWPELYEYLSHIMEA